MQRMTILLSSLILIAGSVAAGEQASESRLDEVQRRGAEVMPFSLEQTTHIFTKTENGGIQQVIAMERADASQVRLIRDHMSKIAGQFAQGDFSDPARIHGQDMPGLAELRKAEPGRIRIAYQEVDNGAQIRYSADDPRLIEAIHRWFDAQLADHARHAVPRHVHPPMHGQ